jgi:hypothetical protein
MFFTESVAEIRDYFGPRPEGTPKSTMQVDMTGPFNLAFADETQRPLNYRERAVVRVAPDANGRITSAELLEPDDDGNLFAVGSKEVNDLVDLVREREIDGTITRKGVLPPELLADHPIVERMLAEHARRGIRYTFDEAPA